MSKNSVCGNIKPGLYYTFMEGLYGRIVHGEGGDVRVEGDGHHAAHNHPFPSVFFVSNGQKDCSKRVNNY